MLSICRKLNYHVYKWYRKKTENNCEAGFCVELVGDSFQVTSHNMVHCHQLEDPGYLLDDQSGMLTPDEVDNIHSQMPVDAEELKKFVFEHFSKEITDVDIINLERDLSESGDSPSLEQRRLCLSSDLFILGLPAWDITEYYDKFIGGKMFESFDGFMECLHLLEKVSAFLSSGCFVFVRIINS